VKDDTLLWVGGIGLGIVGLLMLRGNAYGSNTEEAGNSGRKGRAANDPRVALDALKSGGPTAAVGALAKFSLNTLASHKWSAYNVEKITAVAKGKPGSKSTADNIYSTALGVLNPLTLVGGNSVFSKKSIEKLRAEARAKAAKKGR
jgi:hypothetical protein